MLLLDNPRKLPEIWPLTYQTTIDLSGFSSEILYMLDSFMLDFLLVYLLELMME